MSNGAMKSAKAKRAVRVQPKSKALRDLEFLLHDWEREVPFHPTRKWRFDFAVPDRMVAVEFEGGVFVGGGHTRGTHYSSDCEKYAEAAILGWIVVRVTAPMVRDGRAFDLINKALNARQRLSAFVPEAPWMKF